MNDRLPKWLRLQPDCPTSLAGSEGGVLCVANLGYYVLTAIEYFVMTGQLKARGLPREILVHGGHPVMQEQMRTCIGRIHIAAKTEKYLLAQAEKRGLLKEAL